MSKKRPPKKVVAKPRLLRRTFGHTTSPFLALDHEAGEDPFTKEDYKELRRDADRREKEQQQTRRSVLRRLAEARKSQAVFRKR